MLRIKNHLAGNMFSLHFLLGYWMEIYGMVLIWHVTCRGKNQRGKVSSDGTSWANETDNQPFGPATDAMDMNGVSGSSKTGESESEAVVSSLQDRIKWLEQHVVKKVDPCSCFFGFFWGAPISICTVTFSIGLFLSEFYSIS